jgi:hypothetical protein
LKRGCLCWGKQIGKKEKGRKRKDEGKIEHERVKCMQNKEKGKN